MSLALSEAVSSSRLGAITGALGSLGVVTWCVGYMIWVIYALRNGLGWLDPWEMKGRAMVSGIVPTLLLAAFYPLWWAIRRFYRWTQREVKAWEQKVAEVLTILGFAAIALYFLFDWFADENNPWTPRFVLIGPWLWIIASLFTGKGDSVLFKLLAVGYSAFIGVVTLAALIVFYAWSIFPDVPQELGGPGAKCVVLDLASDRLGASTAATIMPSDPAEILVGQSKEIHLVLETQKAFYLRKSHNGGAEHTLYRIDRGAIRAVLPCRAAQPPAAGDTPEGARQ